MGNRQKRLAAALPVGVPMPVLPLSASCSCQSSSSGSAATLAGALLFPLSVSLKACFHQHVTFWNGVTKTENHATMARRQARAQCRPHCEPRPALSVRPTLQRRLCLNLAHPSHHAKERREGPRQRRTSPRANSGIKLRQQDSACAADAVARGTICWEI